MSTQNRPTSGAGSPNPAAPGATAPASKTGTADVVRIPRPPVGPGRGGGPFGGMNIPAEKAMNFGPSAKRLLGTLRPERAWLLLVLVMGIASVALSVIGPTVWAFGSLAHIQTGIPTRPTLFGAGSGAMPMLMADRCISSIAICATSRGVGPVPEFGGGSWDQIVMSRPVCGWSQ